METIVFLLLLMVYVVYSTIKIKRKNRQEAIDEEDHNCEL